MFVRGKCVAQRDLGSSAGLVLSLHLVPRFPLAGLETLRDALRPSLETGCGREQAANAAD